MNLVKIRSFFLVRRPPAFFTASLVGALGIFLTVAAAKMESPAVVLSQTTETYRKADLVKSTIEKTITSGVMGTEKTTKGNVYYSHGKIRWETDTPEKALAIINGRTAISVQYASPDFPGKNTVTIGKIDPKKGADQRFIVDLLENKKPAEKFDVTSVSSDEGKAVLNLEPKNPSELKSIKITIDKKKKCIQEISYKDDAENVTTIKLGEPQILDKEKGKDLFDYKTDTEKDQVTRT